MDPFHVFPDNESSDLDSSQSNKPSPFEKYKKQLTEEYKKLSESIKKESPSENKKSRDIIAKYLKEYQSQKIYNRRTDKRYNKIDSMKFQSDEERKNDQEIKTIGSKLI